MAWTKSETLSNTPDALGRKNAIEAWSLKDRDGVDVAVVTKDADDAVSMTVGGAAVQTGAGSGGALTAVLTADASAASDTLTAVTDLTLTLEASKWYYVTGMLKATASPAEGGVLIALNGGTVTVDAAVNSGSYSAIADGVAEVGGTNSLDPFGSSATDWTGSFALTIYVTVAGTLSVAFAQSVTHATPSVLVKGATIQALDVTP